jgi:ribosomal protein S27E
MSFEGREVSICGNGHLIIAECTYGLDDPEQCHCGSKIEWTRMIDDTNCEASGDFPIGFFKVKTGEVTETCPTCNHTKLLYETTYEIPTCPKCKSRNIVSDRRQPEYGGTPFVGDIKCADCGTVLFGSHS